ncbi:hypothetical protein L0F63_000128, partial [Massospora cicadina]
PSSTQSTQNAAKGPQVGSGQGGSTHAFTINPSKIQEDIEEIIRANQSEQTSQAEEDMEEII